MYIDAHTIITAGSVLEAAQLAELSAWYIKWLDVTRTRVIPDRPSWLDEL